MPASGGDADVEVDVEALYRAAALLRDASAPLGDAVGVASRAHGDGATAAGSLPLSTALAGLARRWDEAVGGVARRIDESATVLRATVDAFVAADEAGARGVHRPR